MERDPNQKQFAYSTIEIKAVEEASGRRLFKGIATTPTPDREGDIVEPKGAEFQLPIPLCWMHNTRDPVGWIHKVRITDAGIQIDEGEFANLPEPASLKERLDTAWAMAKSGLVRGLSIGFKPKEYSRIGDTFSYRYLKWLWLELSPVTVAANGDCSITSIKSIDQAVRSAASRARPVVRLDTPPPADTGNPSGTRVVVPERRKGVLYLD